MSEHEIQGPGDSDMLVNVIQLGKGEVMKLETGESATTYYLRIMARSLASPDEVSEHVFHVLPFQLADVLEQAMRLLN